MSLLVISDIIIIVVIVVVVVVVLKIIFICYYYYYLIYCVVSNCSVSGLLYLRVFLCCVCLHIPEYHIHVIYFNILCQLLYANDLHLVKHFILWCMFECRCNS